MNQSLSLSQSWLDRQLLRLAPQWQFKRLRARVAVEAMYRQFGVRRYEGAAGGRRTSGWRTSGTDAVQATGPFLSVLRDRSRDLVRNNGHAESALSTIHEDVVGWGILARNTKNNKKAQDLWDAWAGTTACDSDGMNDFYGLQELVMRTIVESGEVLVRRRFRRPDDGLPIAMQLQVLEPDYLDTTKDSIGILPGGFRIIQGVEYNAIGQRVAYWLYPEHPGSAFATATSTRVPAENVLHVFKTLRAGQVRGVSWFAPVLIRFRDFDEYEDATLVKQKIAACLAVITSDVDGTAAPLGTADTTTEPQIDSLEPGMILNVPPGRSVETVTPPTVREYGDYSKVSLRAIAAGIGVPYEDMTNDYADMPFSAARMKSKRYWKKVESWRWRMMMPRFCTPAWQWAMQVAGVFGSGDAGLPYWTAPPAPMIDPVNEGLAYTRNIRAGIMSLSEALRERGYDPDEVLREIQRDLKLLDQLGLVLDSDPRKMTQAGQLQGVAKPAVDDPTAGVNAVEDELISAARELRVIGGRR